jgi:signal peptidase I
MRRRTVVLLSLSGVLGVLFIAGVLIRTLGMEGHSYRAASESMVPTLEVGQRVLVNRIGARFSDPKVGDIVVFHPPAGAEQSNECGGGPPPPSQACATPTDQRADVNFIKRVVAGPGDKISIRDGHVVLNGKPQKEPFIEPCGGGEACDLPREITIPADHYFMMGDNRGSSDDSRFWGPVPRKWIIGEAFATYWPPKRIGLL